MPVMITPSAFTQQAHGPACLWMLMTEGCNQARQDIGANGLGGSQGDDTSLAGSLHCQGLARLCCSSQKSLTEGQQRLTLPCQPVL